MFIVKKIRSIIYVLILISVIWFSNVSATVRQPAVAGAFYPADSAELARMVQGHLNNVKNLPSIDGQIIALIVPHAGLIYSGPIAAYSYKLLENSGVDKVILCGPSHRYGFEGLSVYGPGIQWKTPLGVVSCNDSLCNQLLKYNKQIAVVEPAHAREHSLEVQLPYLQTVLGNFQIVPIIMGYQHADVIDLLTKALESLPIDKRTIMVAASDWQHYRPASEGWKMDSLGLECLKNLDPTSLEKYLESGRVEACAGGPMVAVLKAAMAKGANKIKILKYGDSGDVTGDKSSVVSYVAAVIYKSSDEKVVPKEKKSEQSQIDKQLPPKFQLSDDEKKKLLTIARQSIERYLADGSFPDFEVTDNLKKPGAAFVTLTKNGQLRGCIGHIIAQDPLYKTVSVCAVQAAVADPRFSPVQADEVPQLHIEISVLTPLQEVKSLDEIEVGRDGLVISMGNNRGLLLPQVATEYGWSRTEFLEQTCRKAGLPTDAYQSPSALIQKFQAVIFHEE
jgi:AmmeMemoRadiSam system protein B/AmmeMemoRadiSam system protein A